MDQQLQGTLYMKQTAITKKEDPMTLVPQTKMNDKTHHVYMTITNLAGNLYSDQTGHFPVTSIRGNFYVFIFYTVD